MQSKTVRLVLDGNVPSKKNSRIHTRSGASIPNKNFAQWQEAALWQVRSQTRARYLEAVKIDAIIYFGTRAKADADNRLTSILDMLVEGLVLKDDSYQLAPDSRVIGVYRKGAPGAFVRIQELDPEQLDRDIAAIIAE